MVVCYDIPDDRRRLRVGKVLEGYGSRVQKSVFECDLAGKEIDALKRKLARAANGDEDNVRYYYLCSECVRRVEVGHGPPVEKAKPFYIV